MLHGPRIIKGYRRQEGYYAYTDPDKSREGASFTCQHCNRVHFLKHGEDPANIGGLCKVCMGLICPQCSALDRCDPIEAKIERWEAEGRLKRSL